MKQSPRIDVVDLFLFNGEKPRVLFVPIGDPEVSPKQFIDIKTGELVTVNDTDISMKMTFCEFKLDMNMHPKAKELIIKHFAK